MPQLARTRAACSWGVERFSLGPKLYAVATAGQEVWAVGVDAAAARQSSAGAAEHGSE